MGRHGAAAFPVRTDPAAACLFSSPTFYPFFLIPRATCGLLAICLEDRLMHVVHKYPLSWPITALPIPDPAEIVHVGVCPNTGVACAWVLLYTEQVVVSGRAVYVYGTGHELAHDKPLTHIGTFFEGESVWHAFECRL